MSPSSFLRSSPWQTHCVRGLVGGLLVSALAACALTSKATPLTPRIFRPNIETRALAAGQSPTPAKVDAPSVRIGRVRGTADLREPIAFRLSDVEMGFYEDRRWGERPEAYLRRAVVRALFERDGLGQVIGGGGPTLDLELIAFEEIRGDKPRARVAVEYALHDERTVLIARTVVVEKPIAGATGGSPTTAADAAAFVAAISLGISEAVDEIARDVGKGLRNSAVPSPPPPGTERTKP